VEYGINLKIKAQSKNKKTINDFIECLIKGELSSVTKVLKGLDKAQEKYQQIFSNQYYGNYIEYIKDCPIIKGKEMTLEITTGGLGPEFTVALVGFLGNYCDKVSAEVTHDEDYGHIPVIVTYSNGKVYEDGKETPVKTFEEEEEEINLWIEEPILDAEALKTIHCLAKTALKKHGFAELARIYVDLFVPIVFLAKTHDLLTDILVEDDKQEYLEYIQGVVELDVQKSNHPAIILFKNKMFENLREIAQSHYLGSIFQEYKKTLLVFYTISDLHTEDREESFEEFFAEVVDEDDFELAYEMMSLLEFGL